MGRLIEKLLAQLLFWIYDFIDTIGAIFNVLTGTQAANEHGRSLLEIFVESAVSTKVLLGLCAVAIIIAGACVGVKIVKSVLQIKGGGEPISHSVTVRQGLMGVFSSVACILFVFMFIAFMSMLLNLVNTVIQPADNLTLSQNLFTLSVQESYVIDEDNPCYRIIEQQKTDPNNMEDGLAWEKDSEGNYILDSNGDKKPIMEKIVETYFDYKKDSDDNYVVESGWAQKIENKTPVVDDKGNPVLYSASDIRWSMKPDEVFGVYKMDALGLFEKSEKGYQTGKEPIVRLESFNLLTAYLVAIVMLISMFMLSIGLVKRLYDIIVLFICMPLVCGTIPLDDGARFRAWRETMMSKVIIAFGAVIALNVFYMLGGYIMGAGFGSICNYLVQNGFSSFTISVFRMVLLLGGAMCINASQTLIARIMGTSADESREAMQSFATITSGVRLGAAGIIGAGRIAGGAKRLAIGGQNRYGRQTTGVVNYGARLGNMIGLKAGGENYAGSKGGAFMRALGRTNRGAPGSTYGKQGRGAAAQPGSLNKPGTARSFGAGVRTLAASQGGRNNAGNTAATGAAATPKNAVSASSLRQTGDARKTTSGAFKNTRKK